MKLKSWMAVWSLCSMAVAAQAAQAAIHQPVRVTGGLVQGVPASDAQIIAFKGIPFAAPPVGELRWRAPQPVPAWQGVRQADKFGNSCIQKLVYERKPWTYEFMAHNDISEDCLYLNVWTPARSAGDKLAVYVYIYGGGGVEGSSAVPVYDGVGLAKQGVIVVTFNYRLGIFGSFVHPQLTQEAPYHASGNYADLDVIAALKWVHENIARFGGDPSKVTIGGQSAGSGLVHAMVASPLAAGLFRGAINESGTSLGSEHRSLPLAEVEPHGVAFAAAKGAKDIAELRRLSWQEILDPTPVAGGDAAALTYRFGSVIDGYVFTAGINETIAAGKQNDVPTLAGNNRNDIGGQNPTTLYQWTQARAKTAKTPVYTYYWDHTMPGPDAAQYGAFHTSEVPYAMNTLYMSDRPFTAEDHKIADTMSSYWANFIKNGNPNGDALPHWYAVGERPGMVMEVGDKYGPIPVGSVAAK